MGNTMSNRSFDKAKTEQEESELKEQCMMVKSMRRPLKPNGMKEVHKNSDVMCSLLIPCL